MNTERNNNNNFLATISNNIPGVIIYQYTFFEAGFGQFTYLSKNAEEYSGYSLNELYKNQELLRNLIDKNDIERFNEAEKASYHNLSLLDIEVKGFNGKGDSKYLHYNSIPFKQNNGDIIWNGILTDTTDKREIEKKHKRTILELQLINNVSELIYEIHDETKLTKEVCKVLIEIGNYKLVWIGVKPAFDAQDQNVRIAAEYGVKGYTKDISINLSDKVQKRGPTANTLNTGTTTILNDFTKFPNFAFWQAKADEYGLKSCIAIALNFHKHVTGNINIYSDNINAFDEQEMKVLETISKNLSTAVKSIRARNQKEETRKLLNLRIKELNVLQHVNKLLIADSHDKNALLNSIAHLLPSAFQFDLVCDAKIKCGEFTYFSESYKPSENFIKSEVICKEYPESFIEVVYSNEVNFQGENIFLKEERNFLNSIAEILEIHFKKEEILNLLSKSEANMSSIFKNTEIGYLLMDSNLIIQSYNDILLKEYKILAGFKLKTGQNFRELLHPNRKEKFNWVFDKITKEKKSFAYETMYTHEAKLNYFEITAIPVINNHEIIGYCIAAQNITKRKEMENVNKETNSILMRRNNDLEQFAFIVSHNLRAPVANIVALNTLLKESNDPIEKEEILDNIDISTERLENVIVDLNEILKVKKNVSELNEYINFKAVLQQASETLNKQIETSKIQITSNFTNCESTESIKVYFNSIFYNLISNSIKYAKNNVVPELHVWSEIDQDHIYLHFKDNGLGIDLVKFGTQLFGLYKRFNNNSEGNGIGLYMVKTQLESMGGHIFAKSQPNEGTEFTITLPRPNQENSL
jgi:PAS domain S-box-containing protein